MDSKEISTKFYFPTNSMLSMDLRDWFAGQALAGFLHRDRGNESEKNMATWCYRYADAMLEARKQ